MLGWWSDKQAQRIALRAKKRSGAMWSWFARAMKEAMVSREVVQFLRGESQGDLPKVGDVVDLFEKAYEYAGLRPNKKVKKGEEELELVHSESRTFRPGE